MLRIIRQNIFSLKSSFYAAFTLAFASFGDAFLYPFLPQYPEIMKTPVLWIGVLLSINRFIRILFNGYVIKLFEKYGVRAITILGAVMAIVSTIGYGLGWGLVSLILFRIMWGMAFSILRISSIAYAFETDSIGRSLGVSRSIQEAGPMLALWMGPILLNYFSPLHIFFLLGILSIPALYCAFLLPNLDYMPALKNKNGKLPLPSLFNLLSFCSSILIDGVLIILAGLFLAKENESLSILAITSLAAAYLGYRRVCSILLSPIIGSFADRVGFARVFNLSMLLVILGLLFLLAGYSSIGLVIIFTFNSINNAMAPGGASINEIDKIRAVAVNSTWRDGGAAIGTLAGGFLLSSAIYLETFIIITFILSVLLFFHFRQTQKQ